MDVVIELCAVHRLREDRRRFEVLRLLASGRTIKEVATRSRHLPELEAIRFGETMRKVAAATDDAREGGRAFAEKRSPEWRAR